MLFHRSTSGASPSAATRVLLLASIAALVMTTFEAQAAPVARSSSFAGQELASAADAEIGARKRSRARRNNAAGLAMMGMMMGTVGAVIAAQQRREAYEASYYGRRTYGYYPQPHVYHHPRAYRQPRVYHQPRVYRNANPQWHDRLQRIDPQNPNSANPTGVPRIGW
jgi:hypothetical protein